MLKEFKNFAIKGNLIDMAIGIILGAAFGKVVASLVADVIMPPLGLLIGGVNFTDLSIVLKSSTGEAPAVTLNYGAFIQVIFDFLIIAFAIFMVIKGINSFKKKEAVVEEEQPATEPEPTKEEILLTEIRDLLKEKK